MTELSKAPNPLYVEYGVTEPSLQNLMEGIKMAATCLHPEYFDNIVPMFEYIHPGYIIPGIKVRPCQATGDQELFLYSDSRRLYDSITLGRRLSPQDALQAFKWDLEARLAALSHAERAQNAACLTGFRSDKVKAAEAEIDGDFEYIEECPSCGEDDKAKLKKCARCLAVWYCSKECQKKDWKDHKKYCRTVGGGEKS